MGMGMEMGMGMGVGRGRGWRGRHMYEFVGWGKNRAEIGFLVWEMGEGEGVDLGNRAGLACLVWEKGRGLMGVLDRNAGPVLQPMVSAKKHTTEGRKCSSR